MKVAFFGLGNLGGPIADALIDSDHDVCVYDPMPAAMTPRVERGARGAASAADAVHDADVVIVIVRDDEQVLGLLTAATLAAMPPHAIVALHSTVAPATVREVADRCAHAGLRFIDAGISNGGARRIGEQVLMVGGDQATLAEARPVFEVYCREIFHFGPLGSGMKAKLIRNAMRYAIWAVQHEGLALAEAAGLDLEAMAQLYRATLATAPDDEMVLRRATQTPYINEPAFVVAMSAATTLGWKDLHDAELLAEETGVAIPLAVASRRTMGPVFGVDMYEESK